MHKVLTYGEGRVLMMENRLMTEWLLSKLENKND